jgi:NADH-quinone oxidoreductase subunit E
MEDEKRQLEKIIANYQPFRSNLIPLLQQIQAEFGYLPQGAMREVARFMKIPPSNVYGVATFFAQFYFTKRGKHGIKVCLGTACHVKGGAKIMEAFTRELGVSCGCATQDFRFSLEMVNCVGSCAIAPVVMIGEDVYGHLKSNQVKEVLSKYADDI